MFMRGLKFMEEGDFCKYFILFVSFVDRFLFFLYNLGDWLDLSKYILLFVEFFIIVFN